ncbi:MAG: GNAT family N-acetyltransferase [Breznakibacter sp.]
MLSEVSFSRVESISDLQACVFIADFSFGKGYLTLADFSSPHAFVFCAFWNSRIVGFFLSFYTEKQSVGDEDLKNYFHSHGRLVFLKSVGIVPEHRQRGIGTALLQYVVDFHLANGDKGFYGNLWKIGTQIPFAKIVGRMGFSPIKEIPNYWSSDSLKRQYCCDACGKPPCTCSAMLYGIDFETKKD